MHHYSFFDSDYFGEDAPRYFFSYQIRVSGPPENSDPQMIQEGEAPEEFAMCQLTRRHWRIQKGAEVETVEGEGVIGYYPMISKGMQTPFVYESCCPTNIRGTIMSGWFEFKYVEGPKKNQRFKAMIDPFVLDIEPGTSLVKDPKSDQWL